MNGGERKDAVDALVDALMHYIDEASPTELEGLAARGGQRSALIDAGRSAVARARREVAQERRERTQKGMRQAAERIPSEVGHLTVGELRGIFAQHVANDDASATLAARHKKGEMDEAELRSIVADILSLKGREL